MAPRPWTVLPHDPLLRLEDGLWVVEGDLPGRAAIRRRMSVVRLSDGRLAFHNAVPLREEDMRELERHGEPALLLVPNRLHRLDLHAWKVRYPRLRVLTSPPAMAKVWEVVAVDGSWDELPSDPLLAAHRIEGSRFGEAAFAVRGDGRTSLLFGDTVMNNPRPPGLQGLVLAAIGSTGGPKVTPLTRLLSVFDRAAVARSLRHLAALPGLARLVPSHGAIVERGAAEALRRAADGLHRPA